ncbi:hypothetical protein, partial [Capnocytophaga sputigena]|uniref:hypothetical protein n=1 Tax=Capnocytophaga sputigena TaxID=1019 RepID=UPI0028D23375
RGIRTPGGVTLNGFQDRRIRPLCHLSNYTTAIVISIMRVQRYNYFYYLQIFKTKNCDVFLTYFITYCFTRNTKNNF